MTSTTAARRCFVAGVVVLVVYNVARGLGWFGVFTDASTIGLLLVFVALSRGARFTAADLGLARSDAGRGLLFGAGALFVVTVVLVAVAAIPATSEVLEDSRAEVSGPRLLFEIAVPILLLTVVPEEFVFRGTLLASTRKLWGEWRAALSTSVLFGLWHISPSFGSLSENEQFDDASTSTGGQFALVTASVLTTFVAGLVFAWLRIRSRSLLAPVIAHLGTNGVALIVAWFVVN